MNLEQYAIEDSQIYELLHTIYFYLRVWFVDNRYIKIPSTNNILTDIALQDKAIELWQTQREEIKQKYKSFWDGSSEAEKWNEFVEASIDKKIKAIKLIESSNSEEIKKIVEDVKKQFSTNAKVRLKTNPYISKI